MSATHVSVIEMGVCSPGQSLIHELLMAFDNSYIQQTLSLGVCMYNKCKRKPRGYLTAPGLLRLNLSFHSSLAAGGADSPRARQVKRAGRLATPSQPWRPAWRPRASRPVLRAVRPRPDACGGQPDRRATVPTAADPAGRAVSHYCVTPGGWRPGRAALKPRTPRGGSPGVGLPGAGPSRAAGNTPAGATGRRVPRPAASERWAARPAGERNLPFHQRSGHELRGNRIYETSWIPWHHGQCNATGTSNVWRFCQQSEKNTASGLP